jgi:hypothetical protein
MAKNNIKKLDDQIAYLAASSEKEDDYYYTTTPKTTRFFCGEIETSRYLKTYQQGSKVDFVRGISSYKKKLIKLIKINFFSLNCKIFTLASYSSYHKSKLGKNYLISTIA